MLFDLNYFIVLLLINRVESFRNAYSLTRILSRRFGIINVLDITQDLEHEELIDGVIDAGMHNYSLTTKGVEFVENYLEKGKAMMLEIYPEENAFVTLLFK